MYEVLCYNNTWGRYDCQIPSPFRKEGTEIKFMRHWSNQIYSKTERGK